MVRARLERVDPMKRHPLALIAIVLAVVAGPAMAQPARHSLPEREARIATRIDQAVRNGSLDRERAARLRDRLRKIRKLEAYYRRMHGLSAWERRDVERRLKALSASLAADEHGARRR